MSKKDQGTYQVQVECSNCDHRGEIQLPKGELASGEHECPNCGCKTARKVQAGNSPVKLISVPYPAPSPRPSPFPEPWSDHPVPWKRERDKFWMQTKIAGNTNVIATMQGNPLRPLLTCGN